MRTQGKTSNYTKIKRATDEHTIYQWLPERTSLKIYSTISVHSVQRLCVFSPPFRFSFYFLMHVTKALLNKKEDAYGMLWLFFRCIVSFRIFLISSPMYTRIFRMWKQWHKNFHFFLFRSLLVFLVTIDDVTFSR